MIWKGILKLYVFMAAGNLKGEPQQLPIYQSTTFRYETSEQMVRLFDLEDSGYFYPFGKSY